MKSAPSIGNPLLRYNPLSFLPVQDKNVIAPSPQFPYLICIFSFFLHGIGQRSPLRPRFFIFPTSSLQFLDPVSQKPPLSYFLFFSVKSLTKFFFPLFFSLEADDFVFLPGAPA